MSRFDGRVAIVSGGGSGLGKAVARTLAGEGGLVAIVDISDDAVSRTVGEINNDIERSGSGGTARGFVSDVSDPDRVRATIDAIAADLGRPEILINSAGIGNFANSHEVDPDNWLSIVGVNLNGTFYMCRYALPYLLDGGGNIVNIASNAGLMGQAFSAAYCASKGGVVNLTRALAVEYLKSGVRVNAVAPGGIDTPLITNFVPPPGADLSAMGRIMSPLGLADATEIAELVAFIASEQGRYMTGSIVSIDGGLTA